MNREQRLAKRERMKQVINLEILGDCKTLSELFKEPEIEKTPFQNLKGKEAFVRLVYKQIPNELIAEFLGLNMKELATLIGNIYENPNLLEEQL